MLNALWITVMNAFYRKVATYLNNLQNHRTDTQVRIMRMRRGARAQLLELTPMAAPPHAC